MRDTLKNQREAIVKEAMTSVEPYILKHRVVKGFVKAVIKRDCLQSEKAQLELDMSLEQKIR